MVKLEKDLKNDVESEVTDPNWYLEMAKGFSAQ